MDNDYVEDFLNVKSLEGCSAATIKLYGFYLRKFFESTDKNALEVTTSDIRNYLVKYKQEKQVSNVTLDNARRVYTSFFRWMHREGNIVKDPSAAVQRIKTDKIIKTPFSNSDIELLRENVQNDREEAILEVLYSSGIRVGELVGLNRSDIDWNNGTAIVFGKGHKEREVYFSAHALAVLNRYLKTRTDNNDALFVGKNYPHNRLSESTHQKILKELGERAGVHCHPHRFRRTCATNLLNKGMPVQEVSKILGHAELHTTMLYCAIDQNQVAADHRKFMN